MIGITLLTLAGVVARPDSIPVARLNVVVDSAHHRVVIEGGPYRAPSMRGMDHHAMDHGMAGDTPLERFAWPIDGWLRGFRLEVVNGQGEPIPRRLLHHLIVVNFGRRQLLYPMLERVIGAGAETPDLTVPATVGIPMSRGMPLGMYIGWHNETERDYDDVRLRLTLSWTPNTQMPRPVSVLPLYMDTNLTVGVTNSYDVPPGVLEKGYEFTLPIGGRLLALGGHLHDYGVLGPGRALHAGRRYRVVGVYRNPTGETVTRGAMAHLVGLFEPDDLARWPALDLNDPVVRRDIAALEVPEEMNDKAGHETPHHHDPSHP
jgi:hypothetical protein